MKLDRQPWHMLIGMILGIGLGLLYSWVISPVSYSDTPPALLRSGFKDQFRAVIAAAYLSTGDIGRAQVRLALLGDPDPAQSLTMQAQKTLAEGGSPDIVQALGLLAAAIKQKDTTVPVTVSTEIPTQFPPNETPPIIATIPLDNTSPFPPETHTPATMISPTPRPTHTSLPTIGVPYILITNETICDPSLPEGLLQVTISDAANKQVAGMEIIITWDDGEESFFTGLKPEIGNGYADYVMSPSVIYTLYLAAGSDPVPNLRAPSCHAENGDLYWGGLAIEFRQP